MYLLWVLSTNLPANTVAMNHAMTKVLRSHRDRPALGLSIMDGAKAVMTTDSATGKEYEAMALPLAEARLQAELDLIARGLYFAHFRAKWTGAVLTHADFVARLDADGSSAFDAVRLEVFQMAETLFAGAARYGENPEVFWYQVSNAEVSGICVMRLGFYGSCTATVFFGTPPA